MGKQVKQSSEKLTKKQIDEKMKDLNTRLMSAKNEFFRVLVYEELVEIMHAEALHWSIIINECMEINDETIHDTIIEAKKHINSCDEFINKVYTEIKKDYAKALEIQQAMINSHNIPIKKISEINFNELCDCGKNALPQYSPCCSLNCWITKFT
jgi:hypothetical protein